MKKLFALFLTLLLALSLAACGGSTPAEPAIQEVEKEFVAPAEYASVILVTINPQVRMYLDAQGNVLAVEAVNKDAKKLLETMELENSHYTDAMEQIVSAANEAGYIHSTTVIHVDIDDDKKNPTVDVAEVEEQIQEILAETAPDLKIQVQVKIKQAKPAETEPTEETQPEPTQCAHTWKDATCFLPKTCTSCGETEGEALGHTWKDATCTDPKICTVCDASQGSPLGHSWKAATCAAPKTCSGCGKTEGFALEHTWAEATCAAPKTCSGCGKTEGVALEHTWTDATCTTPKTCINCGATEGTAPGHSYVDGKCHCGAMIAGQGTWYRVRQDGDNLYILTITLLDGGSGSVWSKSYQKTSTLEPGSTVSLTYQGEDYTVTAGAGDPCYFELSGGSVIVHLGEPADNWSEQVVLQRSGSQMTVLSAISFYGLQAGDILISSLN